MWTRTCALYTAFVNSRQNGVADGQTDRQTDGIGVAYTSYSIYAVAHKNHERANAFNLAALVAVTVIRQCVHAEPNTNHERSSWLNQLILPLPLPLLLLTTFSLFSLDSLSSVDNLRCCTLMSSEDKNLNFSRKMLPLELKINPHSMIAFVKYDRTKLEWFNCLLPLQ